MKKSKIDRVLQRISVYREMRPEEDEDWESWYHAAFDLLESEIRLHLKDMTDEHRG